MVIYPIALFPKHPCFRRPICTAFASYSTVGRVETFIRRVLVLGLDEQWEWEVSCRNAALIARFRFEET